MSVINENGYIASELKSIASHFNLLDKAPNGQATNYTFTKNIDTLIKIGAFDGGQFTDKSIDKFAEGISTVQKILGQNLLHTAINSDIPMPNALRFCINLARERGELQDALLSTNRRNQTVHESIHEYMALFKQNANEIQTDKNLQFFQSNMEKCLEILTNAENNLSIAHQWRKKENPARLLA